MKNKIAIFVGYFQPFHNDYEKIIKKISKKYSKVIIYALYPDLNNINHPFTIKEVEKMIKNSLNSTNYKIKYISNLNEISIKDNYFYFCTDRNLNILSVNKIYVDIEIKEIDIINFIYNKNLECLNYVNEKNIKYLRRLVIPF